MDNQRTDRKTTKFQANWIRSATFACVFLATVSCSESNSETEPNNTQDVGDASTSDASVDVTNDAMRQPDMSADATTCVPLFGTPGTQTGLNATQCGPSCGCDHIVAQEFDDARIRSWQQWSLETPFELLEGDPYDATIIVVESPDFCVATFDSNQGTYRLDSRPDAGEGIVTHKGRCGACSTLQDLAVYANTPDLTDPVRDCGVQGISGGEAENIACLEALGFTKPCAQIWYYNTLNTREKCLQTCFQLLDAPYHLPDGSLNACLACDEEESGGIFKQIAGRTRRNSGLASAICRPCESVSSVEHRYPAP